MFGVIHNFYTLSRKHSSSETKPDKNATPALSSLQPSSALPPLSSTHLLPFTHLLSWSFSLLLKYLPHCLLPYFQHSSQNQAIYLQDFYNLLWLLYPSTPRILTVITFVILFKGFNLLTDCTIFLSRVIVRKDHVVQLRPLINKWIHPSLASHFHVQYFLPIQISSNSFTILPFPQLGPYTLRHNHNVWLYFSSLYQEDFEVVGL